MGLPARCEICHQFDHFDPESNFCARCGELDLQNLYLSEVTQPTRTPPVTLGFWGIGMYLMVGGVGGAFVLVEGFLNWAEYFHLAAPMIIPVFGILVIWCALLCVPVILDHAQPIEMTPDHRQPSIESGSILVPLLKRQIQWKWVLLMAGSVLLSNLGLFFFFNTLQETAQNW